MNRVVKITLEDIEYPLCCSLGAMDELQEKYGTVEQFLDKAQAGEFGAYIDAIAIFMKYGAARMRQFEDKESPILTRDYLAAMLTIDDIENIRDSVWAAIRASSKNEIKAEPKSKKKVEQ